MNNTNGTAGSVEAILMGTQQQVNPPPLPVVSSVGETAMALLPALHPRCGSNSAVRTLGKDFLRYALELSHPPFACIVAGGDTGSGATDAVQALVLDSCKWKSLSPMPSSRIAHTGCVVGGSPQRFLVFGGQVQVGQRASASCLQFDAGTGKWCTLPELPKATAHHATCSVGEHCAFVCGGCGFLNPNDQGLDQVLLYDVRMSHWMNLLPLPTPCFGNSACAVDGSTVVVCGGMTTSPLPILVNGQSPALFLRRTIVYDLIGGKCRDMHESAEFPGRHVACAATLRGEASRKVVTIAATNHLSVATFDMASNSWDAEALPSIHDYHKQNCGAACCAFEEESFILLIGGDTHGSAIALDLTKRQWFSLPSIPGKTTRFTACGVVRL